MNADGFNWVWNHEHQTWTVHPEHPDHHDNEDFLASLHRKEQP